MERLEAHRSFFANLVTASAGLRGPGISRLVAAFASTPRERFVGPGPWKVFTAVGYIETPADDPAFLYQDVTVALKPESQINNGQPMLHALCLATLNPQEGETAVHIGAGTGYYTALLAQLVGPTGTVVAYEIEPDLAQRATTNLADFSQVAVHARSASEGALPECDILYGSAGVTGPLDSWLDAIRPGGRLLVPLTPAQGAGAMLLVTRTSPDRFEARFVCRAMFIPCTGARDEETAQRLTEAFKREDMKDVKSLRRGTPPDETCWCAGPGWWLSTSQIP
ncbi:MAG TPA: protein-L-isoaspartate(D-aspartate) O-methyltransferase [Thermoanaerobaculia bacterium]|jgi:protein-L-isoaspartate(D-aspartate) O-methyltransferase|nr:protein-L-isoaspartate(D-aspartate) O-methyltransferase [Thermoanaerobaculia bacterium]